MLCSPSEFAEMLVSYLGADSPAACTPGTLGREFSAYSGGRRRFVVDRGGWEVERVQMIGDGWVEHHDHIAGVLFGLAFDSGVLGVTEPRTIFDRAVPLEVLLAQEGRTDADGRPISRPGAIPDAALTVGGRRLLYDVKVVHLCRSGYWPSARVAQQRGGMLEFRAAQVPRQYAAAALTLESRTAQYYRLSGLPRPEGAPTAPEVLRSFPPCEGSSLGVRLAAARVRLVCSSSTSPTLRPHASGVSLVRARLPRRAATWCRSCVRR